ICAGADISALRIAPATTLGLPEERAGAAGGVEHDLARGGSANADDELDHLVRGRGLEVVRLRHPGRAGFGDRIQAGEPFPGRCAVIAAVPAAHELVVGRRTLDRGLDRLFSTRPRAMIEQSLTGANAYVSEHADAIRGDLLAMAYDLGRAKQIFDSDRDQFQK